MIDDLRERVQKAVEGQYALVRLLGRGGMGAVYLARDQELDRLVALKVLPPDASNSDERRARLRREAQLAAKLTHPNIVPLHWSPRERRGFRPIWRRPSCDVSLETSRRGALLTGLPADWIAWRAYLSILAPRDHNV